MILGTFTKRMKKGKDQYGKQRWQDKPFVISRCICCNEQFTMALSEYKKKDIDTCHKCNKHSREFLQDPYYYVKQVQELYSSMYDIVADPYTKAKDKVTCICKIHQTSTKARIADLLYAQKRNRTNVVVGPCLICQSLVRRHINILEKDKNKPATLYYIYIPDIQMYKLGISSQKKIYKRMYHKPFTTIWTLETTREKGSTIEYFLQNLFKSKAYIGAELLLKDGNRELYMENIIPDKETLFSLISDLM